MSAPSEHLARWRAVHALMADGRQHDWAVEALLAAGPEPFRRLVPLLRAGDRREFGDALLAALDAAERQAA